MRSHPRLDDLFTLILCRVFYGYESELSFLDLFLKKKKEEKKPEVEVKYSDVSIYTTNTKACEHTHKEGVNSHECLFALY